MGLALKIAAVLAGLYAAFLLCGGVYFYVSVLHRTRKQHRALTTRRFPFAPLTV